MEIIFNICLGPPLYISSNRGSSLRNQLMGSRVRKQVKEMQAGIKIDTLLYRSHCLSVLQVETYKNDRICVIRRSFCMRTTIS